MDYKYDGISAETLILMSENRFRNSKPFYEEHKKQLKEGFIIPMRQVVAALADTMHEIDSEIMINPERAVSRIRRDTRFSKDKSLYRENLWTMFMRDREAYPSYPCMWFEVTPAEFSGGVGTFNSTPKLMEYFRKELVSRPKEFISAVNSAGEAGCSFSGDFYKKKKEGCPDERLDIFYNAKSFYFIFRDPDVSKLQTADFIEEIRGKYLKLKPLYRFLLSVSDKYAAEKD